MRTDRPCTRRRIAAAALCGLVLLSGGIVDRAHAISGIVHDPQQTLTHLAEFREQMRRWDATVSHYRQQLIRLRGMQFGQTAMNETFPEVPLDYGMEDACRKANEGVVGAVTELFRPNADAEIIEQQLLVCRRIVQAENMKYNETVRFLNNMRARQRALGSIDQARDGVGTEQGRLQAVEYDLQRYERSTQMDHDRWSAMIVAYDNYIGSLHQFQKRLADRALRGKQPDVFSSLIQGALLKKSLNERRSQK